MNPKTDKVNGKVITAKEDSIMKNKTQAVEACIGTLDFELAVAIAKKHYEADS